VPVNRAVPVSSGELMLDTENEAMASIDEALYILFRRHGRVILLLDRFNKAPLSEAIADMGELAPESLPLDDVIFKDDPTRAPLIVELKNAIPAHHALLRASIELAYHEATALNGAIGMCAWLFTAAPMEQLRNALSHRLTARYPTSNIYFRYFDPRVMPRLAAILAVQSPQSDSPNSSFTELLGPVEAWCQLGRKGQFLQYDNPAPNAANIIRTIQFDDPTAAKIDRIEVVNLVARQLAMKNIQHAQNKDELIDGFLVDADRLGLKRKEDRVAYAWRAASYGKPFTEHEELKKFVVEAGAMGIPLDCILNDKLPELA
jgi:hypothetical protein